MRRCRTGTSSRQPSPLMARRSSITCDSWSACSLPHHLAHGASARAAGREGLLPDRSRGGVGGLRPHSKPPFAAIFSLSKRPKVLMPLKRAQLAIFEASAKIFRTDRKTPTCLTTMRVWTFGRIESRAQQLERGLRHKNNGRITATRCHFLSGSFTAMYKRALRSEYSKRSSLACHHRPHLPQLIRTISLV